MTNAGKTYFLQQFVHTKSKGTINTEATIHKHGLPSFTCTPPIEIFASTYLIASSSVRVSRLAWRESEEPVKLKVFGVECMPIIFGIISPLLFLFSLVWLGSPKYSGPIMTINKKRRLRVIIILDGRKYLCQASIGGNHTLNEQSALLPKFRSNPPFHLPPRSPTQSNHLHSSIPSSLIKFHHFRLQDYIFLSSSSMAFKKINGYIIHLKEVLGRGSYGEVFKGEQQSTKKICAIKVLTKALINSDEYLKGALMQEIQILQQVKSKNIVAVYEVMESSNNYYIIQELCDSDLEKFMKENGQVTEKRAIEILRQIVNGFVALIKEGIVHRDMKPANILISNGEMKIADFGFAKKCVTKKMKNETAVGTPLYMSLELLKGEPYTSKCDIWGVGFMFYELVHRRTPWTAGSIYELIKNIENKPLVINPSLGPDTKDFLRKTLAIHEKDRIEWDQLLEHPIFEGYFDQYRIQNKKIQDKFKSVMSSLRFKINSQNIDVSKLFNILGFKAGSQLSFRDFHKFLDYISPQITEEEVRFFFDKVDVDESSTISIEEIEKELLRHNICIDNGSRLRKADTYKEDEQPVELSQELREKAKRCFQRLYRVLTYKRISLKKTFQAYDKQGEGNLSFECFKNMINRLDSSFTIDDIILVFDAIDTDHSKTIEFEELNAYYCKVNGLPFSLDENGEFQGRR